MPKDDDHIFQCVHCKDYFVIAKKDFNCKILRHGVMKDTGKPMDPHAKQEECERLVQEGLIYGCGKPMRIIHQGDAFHVEICEYL